MASVQGDATREAALQAAGRSKGHDGKPRTVVLAIGTLAIGGTEGQLVELALGIHRRGWDVRVATLFQAGPYAERLERAGIEIYRGDLWSPSRLRIWNAVLFPTRFARYFLWIRRVRPVVIHAFLYHAYVPSVVAARMAGVPTVITARRSLGNFKRGRRLVLLIERLANRCTDLIVANSSAVAEDTLVQEKLPREKMRVISNGVPPRFFDISERVHVAGTVPNVLCVANLIRYKGQADLVDASALAARDGTRLKLLLAGDGPERSALEQRARAARVCVEFLGTCSDVVPLLADADLVVSASHEEGCSNSILEAMAAGRAIIATDVGGSAEVVGDAGVVVPAHNPVALSRALTGLLRDEPRRRELGVAARARARAQFSLERMLDAHLALYTSSQS